MRMTDLAKIHIAKKELGLDDETYRAMVRRIGGVDSAKDLDMHARWRLLQELRERGWKPKPGRQAKARVLASDPQSRKLRALWLEMHQADIVSDPSEAALAAFCRRLTGVERLQWLTVDQARRCIEALKAWQARKESS